MNTLHTSIVESPAHYATPCRKTPRVVPGLVAAAVGLALLATGLVQPTAVARAAFPGANGKIAFETSRDGNSEIYAMNPDGTGGVNLTNHIANDVNPSWSANGSKIVFASDRDGNYEIYVMNADGTGVTRLTSDPDVDITPTWSPDGTQIAFTSRRDGNEENYVMNADGSGQTNVTNNGARDSRPAWSPDGATIAFESTRTGAAQIFLMNPDGSGLLQLTNSGNNGSVEWSPDGAQLTFHTDRDGNFEIYRMNADGSSQTNLTNAPNSDSNPTWSPDGTMIAFDRHDPGDYEVFSMAADGTNQTNLTNNPAVDFEAQWGPAQNTTITVAIDIKPGSFPNSINPRSNGVIPVAILSTNVFDATMIDPLSVAFGPSGAAEAHGRGHPEDVNNDGLTDLVLHFRTQGTGIQCGDTSASLSGETFGAQAVSGSDSIRTVGCK